MNQPGNKFGRYEAVAELGRGAMGVVYKARDPQIDRFVAVKTVSLPGQEPEQEKEYRQRFLHEAQAAGRLHHPGIVAVFDVGENPENHNPYIVLEYVAGESLNRILMREKKLASRQALQLALEVAEALDYAHARGVIHRDIKPGNILVTESGHAKIADFGIAKLNLAHFTIPGRVLGTPAYMAPEQLSGEGVDGRSDLFSLGVILYAMVTGHSPFQGDSATTVCFKVVNREPVPASSFELGLPQGLDAVISRAMAKSPADRYQRGSELAGDLRQLLDPTTGLTATSLLAISSSHGGSDAAASPPKTHPDKSLAQAQQLIWTAVHKASVRELLIAAALVAMLIIVGIPSRQAVVSEKAAASAGTPSSAARPGLTPVSASPPPAGESQSLTTANHPPLNHPPLIVSPGASKSSAPARVASAVPAKSSNTTVATKRASVIQPSRQTVVPNATLELAVQHQFKEATLSVWIDDKLALTRPLHGGTQKRLVVFNGVRGVDSQTLQIPAGSHQLRLQATSGDQSINLTKETSAKFAGGDQKTLHVTFDKHNTAMRLNWE